jgi:hypothetical protein
LVLKKEKRGYFEGRREELTGITIPLKYLPCNKKQQGGNKQ